MPIACAWWLVQAHQELASNLSTALRDTGVTPTQIIAMADGQGIAPLRMAQIVGRASRSSRGSDDGVRPAAASIAELRAAAVERDAEVRALQASGVLPAGVSRLPRERAVNYDLAGVPPGAVATAIDKLETNDLPVSTPGELNPADPLFKTLFGALDALGTRTLTMAEMNALIQSDGSWQGQNGGVRSAAGFTLVYDRSQGLISQHELHKFVGGFKGVPGTGSRLVAGAGGESGLFARATAGNGAPSDAWGFEGGIRAFWAGRLPPSRADAEAAASSYIDDVQRRLTTASASGVAISLDRLAARGFFADPRERLALSETIDTLRSSAPNSAQRIASAAALADNLRRRWRAADTISVSGATAEIQMMQTMHRYLTINRVRVDDPQHRIDAVEVYALYRRMLKNNELTSRATVEAWLTGWGVTHVP